MPNSQTPVVLQGLQIAFALNFLWINLSEVARYFLVIRPMLHKSFPDQPEVGAMDWGIFAIWGLWDLILILAATGFYWLWLERFGTRWRQIVMASVAFSGTIFGLIWLGIANMGLAPIDFLFAALPLAWAEQVIACAIVAWAINRNQSPSSIRSI